MDSQEFWYSPDSHLSSAGTGARHVFVGPHSREYTTTTGSNRVGSPDTIFTTTARSSAVSSSSSSPYGYYPYEPIYSDVNAMVGDGKEEISESPVSGLIESPTGVGMNAPIGRTVGRYTTNRNTTACVNLRSMERRAHLMAYSRLGQAGEQKRQYREYEQQRDAQRRANDKFIRRQKQQQRRQQQQQQRQKQKQAKQSRGDARRSRSRSPVPGSRQNAIVRSHIQRTISPLLKNTMSPLHHLYPDLSPTNKGPKGPANGNGTPTSSPTASPAAAAVRRRTRPASASSSRKSTGSSKNNSNNRQSAQPSPVLVAKGFRGTLGVAPVVLGSSP